MTFCLKRPHEQAPPMPKGVLIPLQTSFNNEHAHEGRRQYLLDRRHAPTFDHVDDRQMEANFKICSQITNDCKSHLSYKEFVGFCREIIAYHERLPGGPGNP